MYPDEQEVKTAAVAILKNHIYALKQKTRINAVLPFHWNDELLVDKDINFVEITYKDDISSIIQKINKRLGRYNGDITYNDSFVSHFYKFIEVINKFIVDYQSLPPLTNEGSILYINQDKISRMHDKWVNDVRDIITQFVVSVEGNPTAEYQGVSTQRDGDNINIYCGHHVVYITPNKVVVDCI